MTDSMYIHIHISMVIWQVISVTDVDPLNQINILECMPVADGHVLSWFWIHH